MMPTPATEGRVSPPTEDRHLPCEINGLSSLIKVRCCPRQAVKWTPWPASRHGRL